MTRIEMDRFAIETRLPHRGRALLLDSVEVIQEESRLVRAIGHRIVTLEDCEGHFPELPIMRGVDRVEMITLTLGIAAQSQLTEEQLNEGFLAYLAGFGRARFPGIAKVGDEVRSEATILRLRPLSTVTGSGKAFVGDTLVAEVEDVLCVFRKKD